MQGDILHAPNTDGNGMLTGQAVRTAETNDDV